ncbi:MAG TPA: hypothetical protein VFW87_04795, partial [Pirellulales bacterium]|nr:hypothetical protein [Pirellulales bacterium]
MFSLAAIDGDLASGAGRALVAGGLALVGLAIFAGQWSKVRRTTLLAPSIWALVSLWALVAAEIAISAGGSEMPAWGAPLRFAAAMGTFCPAVALLGAK